MRKRLIKFALGILAFSLALSTPFIVIPINNVRLNHFAEQLFRSPLPPASAITAQHKQAGNMNYTGDNFGFWAYIVIRTDLSEQEIAEYYVAENFKGGNYLRLDIIPYNLAETTISRMYSRTIKTGIPTDDLYIIQLYDHDESLLGLLDFRRG